MHSEYQVDFLPDGKGSAICLRYGVPGHYRVMVYDGGTLEAGKALVAHIRECYGTNVVNDLVCSHPGADHVSGLSVVLNEMDVHELWMHRPWAHATLPHAGGGYTAKYSRATHFKEKMAALYALEKTALKRRIRLSEPFQGDRIGPFMVLSPSYGLYVRGLTPERGSAECAGSEVACLLRQAGLRGAMEPMPLLPEFLMEEPDQEKSEESAENESSIVLFGLIAGQGILLTGNAGAAALTAAVDYAEERWALIPAYLKFAQIPRQRMHRSFPPAMLDRLIGPVLRAPVLHPMAVVFVSTSSDDDGYSGRAVADALARRGALLVETKGKPKRHAWRAGRGDE